MQFKAKLGDVAVIAKQNAIVLKSIRNLVIFNN